LANTEPKVNEPKQPERAINAQRILADEVKDSLHNQLTAASLAKTYKFSANKPSIYRSVSDKPKKNSYTACVLMQRKIARINKAL
jgi:hypothetical protein